MQIRYTGGFTIRKWGDYTFEAAHGMTCSVDDLTTLQEMLTSPHDDFKVSESDPLAQSIGVDAAAEMVLQGVTTVEAYRARSRERDPTEAEPAAPKFFREERGYVTEMWVGQEH